MKEAYHMGYKLLSGIKNGFILKFFLSDFHRLYSNDYL